MPKSQIERMWLFAGAIGALVVLLMGWFMFIGPQRSETNSVNGQTHSAQAQNATLKARIKTLQSQSANLAQYEAELKTARLALPDSSGLSDFLRTLQSLGNATQTNVTSLTVGAPTNLNGMVAGTPATAASAPASSAAANQNVGGLGTVYQLPITLSATGPAEQLNEFLSQLQTVQPRAVLVTQLTEGPANGTDVAARAQTLGLTMQAFVAPSSLAEDTRLASGQTVTK